MWRSKKTATGKESQFNSYDMKIWAHDKLAHLHEELLRLVGPGFSLDGELYVHGWSLQKINGAVSVNSVQPGPNTPDIEFHVFDIAVMGMKTKDRVQTLLQLENKKPHIHVVPTYYVATSLEADKYFSAFKDMGYEGMILRNPESPYGFWHKCGNKENRWDYLLKRKDFCSAEGTIVDVTQEHDVGGDPKPSVGALVVELEDGTRFKIGTGMTHEDRKRWWIQPPIGTMVSFEFERYSDSGVPLKPSVELIHE